MPHSPYPSSAHPKTCVHFMDSIRSVTIKLGHGAVDQLHWSPAGVPKHLVFTVRETTGGHADETSETSTERFPIRRLWYLPFGL